ncbi:MAG: carboxypeptidase M32 [Clostridia bacterium]|nr:carboxypeptidase M32 [Clostridia bacterium]
MEQHLKIYNQTNEKLRAISAALVMLDWDSQTEAPKGCLDRRATYIGSLAEMTYKLQSDEQYLEAVNWLNDHISELDAVMAREIRLVVKGIEIIRKIPIEDYVGYQTLLAQCVKYYFEAKAESDFNKFAPYLDKIVAVNKKFIKLLDSDTMHGYDILLDMYEEGFTEKDYDKFFDCLKEKLVPFVKKVTSTKLKFNKSFLSKTYDVNKQQEFCKYLQGVMCFNTDRGVMKESEHPFTTSVDMTDVRFTVHYYTDNVLSAIFSAIHEMGHSIYEQHIDPSLIDTSLAHGVSLGMHESQSRLYENIIGRSYEFWQAHYNKLQEIFPRQLGKVSLDDFYKGVNLVQRSYIRTEADELTYALHIMVRYDIEKMFIKKNLPIENYPDTWNKLYKKYLGLTVKNDKEGILQDVHWSMGSIGYFPTYALGSAISAQLYHKMRSEIDVDGIVASNNLQGINDWLKEKVHKYGKSKTPKEILYLATGEDFNPDYYVNYLIEKYSKIYNIDNK